MRTPLVACCFAHAANVGTPYADMGSQEIVNRVMKAQSVMIYHGPTRTGAP